MKRSRGCLAAATALLVATISSNAMVYDFVRITGNSAVDVADQLSLEVLDYGDNLAEFRIMNTGPLDSVICGIYFDDGTLLGIATVLNTPPDVVFKPGGTPGHLPGGNLLDPAFETTAELLATAQSPRPWHGVGPGEYVSIVFSLQDGGSYADVLDEMQTGELRVGLHVQALPDGQSDSFVHVPGVTVPDAGATVYLLAASLSALSALYRRHA